MDNKRLEDKLDGIVKDINDINVTLAKQEVNLSDHIRRTNILEEKIAPLEKRYVMVNGVLKFIGLIAVFVGIIEGIVKIFGG